ncbi:DNA-directed RNA polymerase subunit D [archaeon]|nr:DNA-directed RNA polymerase subunit D [archaeon]
MQIIKKSDEKLVFTAQVTESLANSIRRSVGLIPVMAIDELEIAKNDSALYDETLAHRVGLVPLKMSKDIKEDTVLKLKLNKKGPGYVYSKDLNGDCDVVYSEIPLTLLKEGQEVKITAITKVGYGKDHAKFAPGLLVYRNACEITLPKKHKEIISKTFPENTIKEKGENIIIKDDKEKSLIDFCEGLCKKDDDNCEVKDTSELVFTIESFGQISASEIFKQAIEGLKKELKSLKL